ALVCYDTFLAGAMRYQEIEDDRDIIYAHKDYLSVKEYLKKKTYTSCDYCWHGECHDWFYEVPSRIAILYPAYGLDHNNAAAEETIVPHFYESRVMHVSRLIAFDYTFEAMLKSDGSLALTNKTSLVTAYGFFLFVQAFIITLVVEVVGAFVYRLTKKL